jgi:hypothetical protein
MRGPRWLRYPLERGAIPVCRSAGSSPPAPPDRQVLSFVTLVTSPGRGGWPREDSEGPSGGAASREAHGDPRADRERRTDDPADDAGGTGQAPASSGQGQAEAPGTLSAEACAARGRRRPESNRCKGFAGLRSAGGLACQSASCALSCAQFVLSVSIREMVGDSLNASATEEYDSLSWPCGQQSRPEKR